MVSQMTHIILVLLLLKFIHCCSTDAPTWLKMSWPGASPQQCTCVSSRLCPAFLILLQELRRRNLSTDGLRQYGCGFVGFEPLVCCNQVRLCPVVPFDIRESYRNRVYRHQPWPHHGWPEASQDIVSVPRSERCVLVADGEHHGNRNLDPQDDPSNYNPATQGPRIDPTQNSSGVNGTALLPTDLCGLSVEQRIIGGKMATLGSYPWIARLGYTREMHLMSDVWRTPGERTVCRSRRVRLYLLETLGTSPASKPGIRGGRKYSNTDISTSGDRLLFRCGGALFSSQYVVTAAHCVSNMSSSLTLTKIRLGELDERSDPDCVHDMCADPVQDFNPVQISVHPMYNDPKYRNDIALIRLDRPVNFTAYIRPICLPLDSLRHKSLTGLLSTVAGWGTTDLGKHSSSPVLQQLTVKVVPSKECAWVFKERTDTELGSGQLCAGGERGQDSCEGDSGGPLMRPEQPTPDSVPRYFLIGIVSFGAKRCGSENLPGVYTHIASYVDWILETIRP